MKIILKTERLILREYEDGDFLALFNILSDKENMSHYPKPYDENGVRRWLSWSKDNYNKYGFGLWAIELKDSHTFIGDCGITMQNIDNEILPEIGYHINKCYWRQGYGKEAALAVKKWFFDHTKFNEVYSYMTKSNVASYSLAKAIGMTKIKEYTTQNNEEYFVYCVKR